jgi:hypothetical protein
VGPGFDAEDDVAARERPVAAVGQGPEDPTQRAGIGLPELGEHLLHLLDELPTHVVGRGGQLRDPEDVVTVVASGPPG